MERSLNRIFAMPSRIMAPAFPLALASMLALAGCDSGTQEPDAPAVEGVEIEAGAPPETAQRNVEIDPSRFPERLPEGAKAEIPENFPANVPVYPGAKPAIGMGGSVEGSARSGVQLLSNDSPADVLAYYEQELRASGWEITPAQEGGPANAINATNASAEMILFISPSADGGSDIFVVHQKD